MIVRLHHFGFQTDDLEASISFYEKLGFVVTKRYGVGDRAQAAMMHKGDDGVELFQFKDPDDDLSRKINGHAAFATDDIEADVQMFLGNGYELSIPISSGDPVKRFAYVADKHGVQIELCELLDS